MYCCSFLSYKAIIFNFFVDLILKTITHKENNPAPLRERKNIKFLSFSMEKRLLVLCHDTRLGSYQVLPLFLCLCVWFVCLPLFRFFNGFLPAVFVVVVVLSYIFKHRAI